MTLAPDLPLDLCYSDLLDLDAIQGERRLCLFIFGSLQTMEFLKVHTFYIHSNEFIPEE